MVEQKKMSDMETELDNLKLKLAQLEISQESWRQKYNKVVLEQSRISKKNSMLEDSNDKSLLSQLQSDNEALKIKCESLLNEKNACSEKILRLEVDISEARKVISNLESKLRRSSDLKKDLVRYKDMITQLTSKLNSSKEEKNDSALEQRIKLLERDLEVKEQKLQKLKDFEKIKEDRDQLVAKLKTQAHQFEQFIKSQKQVSAELNLSPRSLHDYSDVQKIKEITTKEVREEMEQRVAEELKAIEVKHRQRQKEIEEKYQSTLMDLEMKCKEKTKEVEALREIMLTEKVKLQASFKAQEQMVTQMIEAKLERFRQELLARKLMIEQLQEKLKCKENDAEEERNVMAQVMSEWATEIKEIKEKEMEANKELLKTKENEERLYKEIKELKEKEAEMKTSIETLNKKYHSAKKSVSNYKVSKNKDYKITRKLLNKNFKIEILCLFIFRNMRGRKKSTF